MFELPDHPVIRECEQTGYPLGMEPKYYYCDMCSEELTSEDCYEDIGFEYLCEDCLKSLHRKEWWRIDDNSN